MIVKEKFYIKGCGTVIVPDNIPEMVSVGRKLYSIVDNSKWTVVGVEMQGRKKIAILIDCICGREPNIGEEIFCSLFV